MRQLIALALVAAQAASAGWAAPAQPRCPETPYIITELGAREAVPDSLSPAPGEVTEYPSVAQSGARYIRVQVEIAAPADCEWFLSVRDREYRLIQTFGREDGGGAPVRWTHRIPGDRALFDQQPCADGRAAKVRFHGYIWMPADAANTYYSLQTAGKPRWQELTSAGSEYRRLGDFTGLLMGSFGRQSWSCTGVMITPDLFLTNWHCGGPNTVRSSLAAGVVDFPLQAYWSRGIWEDMVIDLSWDGDHLSRELMVTAVEDENMALDFALLRVEALDRVGPIRPARIAGAPVQSQQQVRLVHHPAGRVKHLSWDCQVAEGARGGWRDGTVLSEFTHLCDTEAGSSGAPVFNRNDELVGLHHLGFDYDTQTCRYLDNRNKAVAIGAILTRLQNDKPALHAEVQRWR